MEKTGVYLLIELEFLRLKVYDIMNRHEMSIKVKRRLNPLSFYSVLCPFSAAIIELFIIYNVLINSL